MNKQELVASAARITPPSPEAAAEYAAKREKMAAQLNIYFDNRPDLKTMVGEGNQEMMQANHRNHALFMESLLANYSPEVLTETIIWVFKAYRTHGFKTSYWPAQLDQWLKVLSQELSPDSFSQIKPVYEWILVNLPHFSELSDQALCAEEEPAHQV